MKRRGNIAGAIILIGVGAFYLAIALMPSFRELAYGGSTWPLQVIALGVLFFIAGILALSPALFIPASIVSGIGGILYYQNLTGNWASWSYMWALIPGFVGIGLILFGVFGRKLGAIIAGLWNIFSSLVLFSIFGLAFGNLPFVGLVWPLALIMLGFFFLVRAFRKPKAER